MSILNKIEPVVALAGNPNTGKSTIFNALTGLRQHTGNWPGKTVLRAEGRFVHKDKVFKIIDLPGTYSLLANSAEEEVARDFICFARPDATVVVTDATCLERNLNLVLQVLEITDRVVVCLNLIDEARRKDIEIDVTGISKELGVPVVPTAARSGEGLKFLKDAIFDVAVRKRYTKPLKIEYDSELEKAVENLESKLLPLIPKHLNPRWVALRLLDGDVGIIEKISGCFIGDLCFKEGVFSKECFRYEGL
ncbi:MAG: iron transporter FeoB [Firmicutes bacterium]|nr:iron transporter FeoB [Bacillota bacterium]